MGRAGHFRGVRGKHLADPAERGLLRAAERREVHRLHEWLSESGLTGILTAKSQNPDTILSSQYGFIQFLADCVVVRRHHFGRTAR